MVGLIGINPQTRFCKFSIDSSSDISFLPDLESAGKETLSTIKKCSQGSLAYATNGKTYILSGANKWILYSGSSSGSSPGDSGVCEDIEEITKAEIESLF